MSHNISIAIGERWVNRTGDLLRVQSSDVRGYWVAYESNLNNGYLVNVHGEYADNDSNNPHLLDLVTFDGIQGLDVTLVDVAPPFAADESGGGKLKGDHYYRVEVKDPISPEVAPYVAECADIIEALNMTFNEGEALKALWRLAAARQGRGKPGNKPVYDADKVAHYGGRVAVCTRREADGV